MRLVNKRRERKKNELQSKKMAEIVQNELSGYLKSDDLKEHLEAIEKDEAKKKLWNSLSPLKKLKVLRHIAAKKGVVHGKG